MKSLPGISGFARRQKAFVPARFIRTFGFVLLISVVLTLGVAGIAQGQETWSFDSSFQRTPLVVTSENVTGATLLSSGKVLMHSINGAQLSGANAQRIGPLIRLDPNTGAIDPTWHPDPSLAGIGFLGVAEAPDGKIYYSTALVGEVATNAADPAVVRLVRLNTDGSRDKTFNSPVFAAAARFLTVQPDGKIIVCTGGTVVAGTPAPGTILQTVRLNTDGSLDATFQSPNFQNTASDPAPSVASGKYSDVGVFGNPVIDQATGKIYFCGLFNFVNGQQRKAIVRCNADGTLDTSFVPTGLPTGTAQLRARGIVLQAGGKVVIGGFRLRTAAGGATHYALLRFNNDGTLDSTFTLFPTTDSSGKALANGYFGPRHLAAMADGKILTSDTRIIRFLADGSVDPTFKPLDVTSPNVQNPGLVAVFRFDLDPNTGVAYLGGPGPLYGRLGGQPMGYITKLNANGTINTTFKAPVPNAEDYSPNVQIGTDGALYVSGAHTAFGNTDNATIAKLRADGTRDPSYSLGALPFPDKQAAGFALLPDDAAYVVYSSGSVNGSYQFSNLVRLTPTGAVDATFRPSSALQAALAINAFDGHDVAKTSLAEIAAGPMRSAYLFPGGPQATVNANGNLNPTRVNSDGTQDTTVPALGFPVGEVTRDVNGISGGSAGYLHRLAQTGDGGFLVLASVAPFPTSTGAPYNFKLIKLRADGSQDPQFKSLSITSSASATLDFPLLTDPVTGSVDQPGFYVAPTFPVSRALLLPDGSFLLAGKFQLAGNPTNYDLAKFSPSGVLNTSFTPAAAEYRARPSRPARVTNVRVAPGGKIWVLGRFDTFGGKPAPGVARLNSDGTLDASFQLNGVGYYDSFGDSADVVFANAATAYLMGTFRRSGETMPFAVTRIQGPPLITSPLTATGIQAQQFTYQFLADGATSLSATNLPPGLTFNATLGAIVGTPSGTGTFQVGLRASNAVGITTATLSLSLSKAPASGPSITSSTSATGRTGSAFSFQVITTGGTAAARLNVGNLPAGLTFDAITGVISGTPTIDGSSAVSLTVKDGSFTATGTLQLTFTSDPAVPVIVSPSTATLAHNQSFTYTIQAPTSSGASDPTTYKLIGTLPTGLFFDAKTGVISGTFLGNAERADGPPDENALSGGVITNVQLFATNSHGTSTTPLVFFSAPVGAVNISTRLSVGTGDNVLIGGFILAGNAPKKLLLRAVGPSLQAGGKPVPGALQDTKLQLYKGATLLGSNDDWRSNQEKEIIDTTVPPTDNRESAIVATLESKNTGYTAVVSGKNNSTGIGLAEIYDLGTASLNSSSTSRLANISTRGTVLTGNDVMIGGFIVSGANTKVIARAIGPELTKQGVAGALQDTTLELRDGAGSLIIGNDDWRSTQQQQIIDTTVPPSDDRESAVVATLPPGNYTAIVRGKDDSTGVALVEVYSLQ